MSREFKRNFFMSLLTVLLVISNLIGMKLTNFLDLTISVDFLTYPFTFLCTLLIFNLGNKKSAYQSVLISALIQIFVTISYTLAIKLGNQSVIPDMANSVNELFKVNELNLLASLFAFLVSHYVLIYIYDNFKHFGKELYGVVIALIGSLFLNATINLVITLQGNDAMFIINMLLSNLIISIIMVIIITILYYLLKEKDVKIVENIDIKKDYENHDMSIEEVIKDKKEVKTKKAVKPRKNYYPKNNKKTSSTKKEVNKQGNKTIKKKKTSKEEVNKTDKK